MGKEKPLVLYLGVYRNDNLVACHSSNKKFLELAAGVLPRIPPHLSKFSLVRFESRCLSLVHRMY